MPFTLSHAAAALPGLRRTGEARGPLVASALVMGTFAPDMVYFAASLAPDAMFLGEVTHGWAGLFTVDVLITAALVGMWLLVREPLLALFPARFRGPVHGLVRGRPWRERHPAALACWFYASAVIGAATHVGWDLFTHPGRWGTRVLPVLDERVAGFPLYTYAQYGSSAVALVLLGWFLARALRRPPSGPPPLPGLDRRERLQGVGLLVGCAVAGTVHRCLRWYAYWGDRIETPLDVVPTACFGAGAGLAVGVVLYGTLMRLRGGRRLDAP
ncbi:DUF4184 family protein [Streptomyces sp. NPDC046887]|uniref:DUF4184 family protein n=1 Tax=Streptomyces sp. NPDC046887 TaxID=3155472 RepID=UPI003410834D